MSTRRACAEPLRNSPAPVATRTGKNCWTWWRGWQDFGVGWLGDMGCHIIDTPFQALKLTAPLRIRAEVEPAWWRTHARRDETWPTWQILHYTFAGNDLTADKTLEFTWSDGGKYPPDQLRQQIDNQEYPSQGALLVGAAGALLLPPAWKSPTCPKPMRTSAKPTGTAGLWRACRSRQPRQAKG